MHIHKAIATHTHNHPLSIKDTFYAKVLRYLFLLRFVFSRLYLLAVHWRYIHFFLRFCYASHFVADMWCGWRNDREFPGNRSPVCHK